MKPKLLLLIPSLTLYYGGAEKVFAELAEILSSSYDITICIFDKSKPLDFPVPVKVIQLNTETAITIWGKVVNFLRRIYQVYRLKRRIMSFCTISFMENANFVNLITRHKDRVIISIRTCLSQNFKGGFYNFLNRWTIHLLYRKADFIVVPSEGIKYDLIQYYLGDISKIKVIPNYVDSERIAGLKGVPIEELELAEYFKNPYLLVTCGKLTRAKGQWHLVRIFAALKKDIPRAQLVIIGDGEMRSYLLKLCVDSGLNIYSTWDDRKVNKVDVLFLGRQANPFKYIGRCALFALPSLWEGFPNILLETLSCSVPIMASDCQSGPREILTGISAGHFILRKVEYVKFGILAPVCDGKFYSAKSTLSFEEKIWADAIKDILLNQETVSSFRIKSKERSKNFNIHSFSEGWRSCLA